MGTILFVDEIHRFNKAQQDVLLPYVEDGSVVLIGATTHNPSMFVNTPLTSRSLVFELRALAPADVAALLDHEQVTTTQLYAQHKMNVKRDLVSDMEWELERTDED